jgi:TonB family protein
MQIKLSGLLILLTLLMGVSFAQTQTTYYTKEGKRVQSPDSAAYKRVLSLSDTNTANPMYNLTDTYSNGKLRLTGKTSQARGTVLEGRCVRYYPNGNVSQIANYVVGLINGNVYDYYPNGKLYRIIQHNLQRPTMTSFIEKMPIIKTCNDSAGIALATDGNGRYIGYSDDFKTIIEEGYIKDGLKVGQWDGEINDPKQNLKFKFTESYADGKLNSGKSTDNDGKEHYYTARSISPMFRGGEAAFGIFLRDHIRYPKDAKDQHIQGRVFISFWVESDGTLTGFKAVRSPAESLAAESLRVLNQSPDWGPGLWYGHPVRIQFTVPINFSL